MLVLLPPPSFRSLSLSMLSVSSLYSLLLLPCCRFCRCCRCFRCYRCCGFVGLPALPVLLCCCAAVLPMLLPYTASYCCGRMSFPITLVTAAATTAVDVADAVYNCFCSAGVIVVAAAITAIVEFSSCLEWLPMRQEVTGENKTIMIIPCRCRLLLTLKFVDCVLQKFIQKPEDQNGKEFCRGKMFSFMHQR